MILTLFLQGASLPVNPPAYGISFTTHFSICHSFLDSYIKGEFGAKSQGRDWRENSAEQPG